jgi:hypothetical protein
MPAPVKIIVLSLCLSIKVCFGYGQNHCLLSQSDAEKILGLSAHLSADSSEIDNHIIKHRCTYTANDKHPSRNKGSNLYYLLEEYSNTSDAEKSFKYILLHNEGMPGIHGLSGVDADEAFIQTDTVNFQLIMARKSDKIIRLKVNKLTPFSSLVEMMRATKNIMDQL